MKRGLLAVLALIACLAVIAIVLTRGDRSDPTGGVERRLREQLTRPGPDQITPNGERPKSIRCRKRGDRRWSCLVRYPSGVHVTCLVGERRLDQGPICE